jgi:protein subunit release factor B
MKNVNDAEEQEYLNKVKQIIRDRVTITTVQPSANGGQTIGRLSSKLRLESEDLGLLIEFDYHRSQIKNRDAMMLLFELMLDDLVK